jgi:SAM-dependent methyltransferase
MEQCNSPLPSIDIQIGTVGVSGDAAMRVASQFMDDCVERFKASPQWNDPEKTLLDFGTGWGRIARCFHREFAAYRIAGVDINPELVKLCREAMPVGRFLVCDRLPPLDLPAHSFDFIVGYSVFSHLSEIACHAWMSEFARILKPGGMVALTTRPRWFFDYAASLSGPDPYHQSLSRMFSDFADAKSRYDCGKFVHSNAAGVSSGDIYGETFIPEQYARTAYSRHLIFMEFAEEKGQPIMFFKSVFDAI